MNQLYSKKQRLTIKLTAICNTIFLFFSTSSLAYADASAKEASNYILNDWIAPIFGVVVVYLVIKEFMNSKSNPYEKFNGTSSSTDMLLH